MARFSVSEILEEEKRPSKLRTIAEIGLPVAGAIAAGAVMPAATPIGAGLGRAVFEAGERIISPETAPPLLPAMSFKQRAEQLKRGGPVPESAIDNILNEVVLTQLGDQFLVGISKVPAVKSARKALAKSAKKSTSFIADKTGKLLDRIVNRIPAKARNEFNMSLAQQFRVNQGIPEEATLRILNKGPKNILTSKNFNKTRKAGISATTLKKVSSISQKAFDQVRKNFDDNVKPVLDNFQTPFDTSDIASNFDEAIEPLIKRTKTGRFLPTAEIDQVNASDFQKIVRDLDDIRLSGTANELHKLKQKLNRIIGKKSVQQVPSAKRAIIDLKNNISNRLDEIVPGYKEVSNQYREVFALEEDLGSSLDLTNLAQTLKNFFTAEDPLKRLRLQEFASKSPLAKQILDEALDERAAAFFRDSVAKSLEQVEIKIPGTRAGFNIPLLRVQRKPPAQIGKELLGREARETLAPISRVIAPGTRGLLGELAAGRIRKKQRR